MNICEHFMTKLIVFCLLVGVVLLSGAPPVSAANVNIPDAYLRKAINNALGANRAATAVVTEAEMKTLTSLGSGDSWRGSIYVGSDLTGLEKATNLTTLNLWGGSGLTDISAVSGLTNLTSLRLYGSFSDISAVSGLTNLTTLNLSGGSRVTDISAVSGLTNLTTLTLYGSFSDISAVSGLTNLTTLTLYGSVSDISALSSLANLTTLTLRGRFTDISALSSLTNLTSLDLWGSGVTDFSALSRLTNLTTLTLGGSRLTDISTVSRLTNLTSLDLIGSGVTDISALSGLTNLTTLTLEGNGVTDFSALSSLTNLTTLDLGGSGVTDISALSRLTKLKTLNLGFVAARDLGLWDLTCNPLGNWTFGRSYPDARVPHPLNSQLRDRTPRLSNISALSGLTNLTWLNLSGQNITDISALSGLTKLTHLYLGGGTRVRPDAGTSLGQTANVRHVVNFPWEFQTVNCGSLPDDVVSNSISDISPLVSNTGLGTGDMVDLGGNWLLSYASIYTHIPALKARGVTVKASTNRVPTTLTKVSGDAQTGATSTALANPFIVEVKDSGNNPKLSEQGVQVLNSAPDPFAGVPVTFAVTGGGGTLSATTVATDANGRAQTTLTPGSTTGTNTVTATVTHAGRTLSVSFTATANNRHPTFTSADTFSVAENTTAVGTVVATDADSQDSVTYAITGGADSSKFAITTAGELTFAAAPNYEAPGDIVSTDPANAAGNNEYILVVTATSGTGARQLTATQTLTITVTDVTEPPGKPGTPTVTAAATTPTSLNVSWTAPPNTGPAITAYNLQYRKNNEANWTSSDYAGTETRTTLTGLTPGTPYDVQVLAKNDEGDGPWSESGRSTTSPNAVPTFTSAATFSVTENATAVGTVVATDADSADNVTGYTITGGADGAKFAITNAGVLTFVAAPDYDNAGDALSTDPANVAGNNEYIVVVTATSGTAARVQSATQTLTITVTNVPAPGKPAAPTVTVASHTSLDVNWTAPTNTGPAIDEYNVQYRAGTTGRFTDANYTGTATNTTLTGLAAGTSYQVQVRAVSPEGEGPWSDASAATTTYQAEDVDSSGDVDINDLVAVVENFGSATPGRNDVDSDGDVDADDIRRVFNELLDTEAAAGAPALTHTAKTLQHYLQQTKARGVGANFQRGLAVLEELLEPFLIPDASSLLHNYPNPFNPETWFPYQLAAASDVTFAIYSVDGRLVRTLSLGYQAAGVYRSRSRAAYWDGRNALGESVASGVYFYTLTAGDFIATGKMLIRK